MADRRPDKITAELLFRILKDRKFLSNMQMLGDISSSAEKWFLVKKRMFNSDYEILQTSKGSEESNHNEMSWETCDRNVNDILERRAFYLLEIHSHNDGSVTPSVAFNGSGDLYSIAMERDSCQNETRLKVKPIIGVSDSDGKNIDVLLVQEKTPVPLTYNILKDYDDMFDHLINPKPEEVALVLENTGLYNALSFRVGKIPDKKYLKRFAFSPELV